VGDRYKREFELNEVHEVFTEYGLTGLERPDPKRAPISAATIAVSYLVGGLIPLLPYVLTSHLTEALKISVLTPGVALLIFGVRPQSACVGRTNWLPDWLRWRPSGSLTCSADCCREIFDF
jgi:hypothetical protein